MYQEESATTQNEVNSYPQTSFITLFADQIQVIVAGNTMQSFRSEFISKSFVRQRERLTKLKIGGAEA